MRIQSIALLLLLGLFWSLQPALVKMAVEGGLPRHEAVLLMTGGVALGFAVFLVLRRDWPVLSRSVIVFIAATALISELFPAIVRVLVAPHLPASLMALVVCTTPVVAATLSALLRTEHLPLIKLAAIGFGLVSVLLILRPGTWPELGTESHWVAVMFTIPLAYGVGQQISFRFWPQHLTANHVAAGQSFVAAVFFLPIFMLAGGSHGSVIMPEFLSTPYRAMYLWIAITLVEAVLFFQVLRREGPVFVSLGTVPAVAFAPLWGAVLFGEHLSASYVWSAAFLLLAVGALALDRRATLQRKRQAE